MEFKSQICTTKEQSERLLALGLKKETADCYWTKPFGDWIAIVGGGKIDEDNIPAWSLHRLIEILGPHRLPIHFRKKGRVDITTSHINQACSGRSGYNYYDSIIDCIAWLINEGYNHFNKDYLEEKK